MVATQKDIFLDSEHQRHKRALKAQGRRNGDELDAECEQYADEQLSQRVKQIEIELRQVMTGDLQLELCVPVWEGMYKVKSYVIRMLTL